MSRTDGEVTGAFVSRASALAAGDDVVELLTILTAQCARLLDVASAGLLLADGRDVLHVLAASSAAPASCSCFQVQREDGPCRDSYWDGAAISVPDLAAEIGRWPQFAPHALAAGFASVHALPCGCVKPGSARSGCSVPRSASSTPRA